MGIPWYTFKSIIYSMIQKYHGFTIGTHYFTTVQPQCITCKALSEVGHTFIMVCDNNILYISLVTMLINDVFKKVLCVSGGTMSVQGQDISEYHLSGEQSSFIRLLISYEFL